VVFQSVFCLRPKNTERRLINYQEGITDDDPQNFQKSFQAVNKQIPSIHISEMGQSNKNIIFIGC
jgi:hypothetical protein